MTFAERLPSRVVKRKRRVCSLGETQPLGLTRLTPRLPSAILLRWSERSRLRSSRRGTSPQLATGGVLWCNPENGETRCYEQRASERFSEMHPPSNDGHTTTLPARSPEGKRQPPVALQVGQVFVPRRVLHSGVFVPDGLLASRLVSNGAKLLWARLARYAGTRGQCFPLLSTLAGDLGFSERQVQRYLAELVSGGFLRARQGNARSSVESRNPRLAHFTTLCAVSQLRTWTVLELPGPGLAPGFVCAL